MAKRIGILRFPGTNCDSDVFEFVQLKGYEAHWLWHKDQYDLNGFEALMIPGGFSFGDYLRSGALAARSPVMNSVRHFHGRGGPILGICNGFQILCESGLLPGALTKNQTGKFVHRSVNLQVVSHASFFGPQKETLQLPVAHGDGRYVISNPEELEDQGQVWLKYQSEVNGSIHQIAGVLSPCRKVAGLMPHPERAIYAWMESQDGLGFLP
ncbi:MAG: phosphoribosylformylglycinamidine synthase subunit PurQ [Proteobacteria bacterium]|nr:phosphoribosylformylglycinamidine synthase subunit PurQ [Pseudomonadota bacterium]